MEGKDGRTERATPKRREEQRRKGNLCVSQEVITVIVLTLSLVGLRWCVPVIGDQLLALFSHISRLSVGGTWNVSLIRQWVVAGLGFMGMLMAPVFILVFVGAVAANLMQTGPYYSTETLSLKFGDLNPVNGFKRLFSVQIVFELALSVLKVGLIVFVLYLLVRKRVVEIMSLPTLSAGAAAAWIFGLMFRMSMTVVVLFSILAVADWCFKKRKYERGMMMTKKEVEEERKNQEPSPVVRGALRRKMRELTMSRMMAAVPKASVVVTNPTHVAVALEYDPETMRAPRVTAKGLRLVAERIKAIAAEHNVPILERPEIARDLYKHVKVGKEVPSRLYGAVAEILAYLYRLGQGRIREVVRNKAIDAEI
jgi:flagellar biosynthesis protein FlhB